STPACPQRQRSGGRDEIPGCRLALACARGCATDGSRQAPQARGRARCKLRLVLRGSSLHPMGLNSRHRGAHFVFASASLYLVTTSWYASSAVVLRRTMRCNASATI